MLTRRSLLAHAGGLVAASAAIDLASATAAPMTDDFPARKDFALPAGQVYLNSAYIHPMPRAAAEAVQRYAEMRLGKRERRSGSSVAEEIKTRFARIINAKPQEIGLIPNTSSGENLVLQALGIARNDGNVVTDALHFDGSLLLYGELQQRGLDLRVTPHRDWRIDLTDMEQRIDRKTKLVAISLVSWYNGFQHDLKAVCDLAHAHGALVYCDIIQAVGATPIDVQATGVDCCACASFKWLMGDFGLGFLYVREDLLDRVLPRSVFGYQQSTALDTHYLPQEGVTPLPVSWSLAGDVSGHFEMGSFSHSTGHCLTQSLAYIERLGPARIEAWRQPLLRRLHEELPRRGFTPLTPPESRSALIAFTQDGFGARYGPALQKAGINVSVSPHRLRVSPSVFNDMRDIEELLKVLS
jgi:selenocysteine lyase/cysteine desulfurase